ncbi:aminotransferase class V-fold PLP-dependent enzyme, partial [Candidatus Saccharibacteria bacterium]|nr:aminotransferase class V-fold PLP-dependent enzyme [Candidatus Saccharibacteria bacterium]
MSKKSTTTDDFAYLPATALYFDSACQSLRPQSVIDAMQQYYTEFNSCGERVKYKWGQEVDDRVDATRAKILKMLKLSGKEYFVSFTLNTTYGINLLLDQLKIDGIKKVVTSDIEHNSPFLSTMTFAKKHDIPREILVRNDDGSIDLEKADFTDAVVVMNAVSNIDGRKMSNIKQVAAKIKKQGGIFIVDAAQTMS